MLAGLVLAGGVSWTHEDAPDCRGPRRPANPHGNIKKLGRFERPGHRVATAFGVEIKTVNKWVARFVAVRDKATADRFIGLVEPIDQPAGVFGAKPNARVLDLQRQMSTRAAFGLA